MHVKEQIRIIGFDDGPFSRRNKRCLLVGCVFRGSRQIDGVVRTYVEVDGLDATERIAGVVRKSKFKDSRVIMLDGITFAGFNIVNIKELSKLTGMGVIAINRKRPNIDEFLKAMKKFPAYKKRLKAVKDAGKIYSIKVSVHNQEGRIYFQKSGLSKKDTEKIIKVSLYTSLFPEPIRVAHLIATGVVLGESKSRA